MREESWLEQIIKRNILEEDKLKKLPGYFDFSVISNVPLIQFPELNLAQNKEIQEQTQKVLKLSKTKYHFDEVAIVYDYDAINHEYYEMNGTNSNVDIFKNDKIADLINTRNNENKLVVICLHNHPNNSLFSINDFYVFTENPSIKIMEIVNTKGEVAFLYKPYYLELNGLVHGIINSIVPDFNSRCFKRLKEIENTDLKFKLSDVLTFNERKIITSNIYQNFKDLNIQYSDYLANDTLNKTNLSNTNKYVIKEFSTINNELNKLNEDIYQENGEDGYDRETE